MIRWYWIGLLALLLAGGVQAELVVDPTSIDFGSIPVGSSDMRVVMVENTGDEALQIMAVVTGEGFSLERPINYILMPGESGVGAVVTFAPTAEAAYEGELQFQGDSPMEPLAIVPLAGTGGAGLPPLLWFELIAPEWGATFDGVPITFSWEAVEAPGDPAISYTLWILGGGPAREPVAFDAGAATTYTLTDAAYNEDGIYMWWVSAAWDGGLAQSSEQRAFNIGEPPPPVGTFDLIAPENEAVLVEPNYTFVWERFSEPLYEPVYELTIIPSNRDDEILSINTGTDTSVVVDLTGLINNQGCVWYVTAYTNIDVPVQSNQVFSFELRRGSQPQDADNPRTEPVVTSFGIATVAPNPFNPETHISLTVPLAGHVKAEVFDVLGRHVATLLNGNLAAGHHSLAWSPNGPAGLYLLRVTHSQGWSDVRRLMFIK